LVIIRGPFDYILGSIGSKVKVMKRSTSSFYHSAVNLYSIGMQLMPKCSLFNAQSCDMRRYALYRVLILVYMFECKNNKYFVSMMITRLYACFLQYGKV